MAVADLSAVKAYLGLSDTDSDSRISAMLEPVTGFIEKYTGLSLSVKQFTETKGPDGSIIPLNNKPLVEGSPGGEVTVYDKYYKRNLLTTEFDVDTRLGFIRRQEYPNAFPALQNSMTRQYGPRYTVTYYAGYSEATMPEDVKLAFYEIIGFLLKSPGALQSEKEGDYSYSVFTNEGLPRSAMRILDIYRASPL